MDAAGLSTFILRRIQLAYSNMDAEKTASFEAFEDSLHEKYALLWEFIEGKVHCLVCCVVDAEAAETISSNSRYNNASAGFLPSAGSTSASPWCFVAGN